MAIRPLLATLRGPPQVIRGSLLIFVKTTHARDPEDVEVGRLQVFEIIRPMRHGSHLLATVRVVGDRAETGVVERLIHDHEFSPVVIDPRDVGGIRVHGDRGGRVAGGICHSDVRGRRG